MYGALSKLSYLWDLEEQRVGTGKVLKSWLERGSHKRGNHFLWGSVGPSRHHESSKSVCNNKFLIEK